MRTKVNPTCQGIELEDLYSKLSNFYEDNYFEYYDNNEIHIKLREIQDLLHETLKLMEWQMKNNNQVKLDNWIKNSNNG
ncbi:MAG TPA: hypothetical protein DC057_13450 [Spirochaetia bacterium]|nr:hypothetical protein [Spirochaetia bacterium]